MSKVIIAEKPSVAKNIADALKIKNRKDGYFEGEGYYITWAFGHLLQLYDAKDYDPIMSGWKMEKFPFIPERFKYKIKGSQTDRDKPDPGAKKQVEIIRMLMHLPDVDGIISATDFDREGQIIGDITIKYIKSPVPVYRLLMNEWTADEVLKGLKKIIPNSDMQSLQDAGIGRQWTDWLIGINLTSVTTLKFQSGKGQVLNIGRVLLPTLKIIYDRDIEIEQFVPEKYCKLLAVFETCDEAKNTYEGQYTLVVDEKLQDKFQDKAVLIAIQKAGEGQNATIIEKETELKREYPPYLFNLSNLQGFITSKFKGWTSDKVLTVAQSLYEKKYITYPRTASVVLEESLVDRASKVLDAVKTTYPFQNEIQFQVTKRLFDNSKVESHSAITPTYVLPKGLTKDEQTVYDAIKNRFVAQFMPIAEHEETKITTQIQIPEATGVFLTKGKIQKVEGWKKVENVESKDTLLPPLSQGQVVNTLSLKVTDHATTAPKFHNEKTLLRVMETCGKKFDDEESEAMLTAILSGFSIGTPATRAETIKKLRDIGYIEMDKKNLKCTQLGKNIVENFPIKDLFDLEYTGKLEKTLSDIEKGKVTRDEFLSFIKGFVTDSVNTIKKEKSRSIMPGEEHLEVIDKDSLGPCPNCGHPVIEGQKGYGCSNWKSGCDFVVWKSDKWLNSLNKQPDRGFISELLANKKVLGKDLMGKKGIAFDAYLTYGKEENAKYYNWKMSFLEKNQSVNLDTTQQQVKQ